MLWYLLATIYILLFVMMLLKKRVSPYAIVAIGFVLILISKWTAMLVSYDGELCDILQLCRKVADTTSVGGMLRGAFYLPCGMLLCNNKIPMRISNILFVLRFSTSCLVGNEWGKHILLIASSVALFCLAEKMNLKNHKNYYLIRKMSTMMYLAHMYVWSLYYKIVYGERTYGVDCFVFTFLISIAISYLDIIIKTNIKKLKQG